MDILPALPIVLPGATLFFFYQLIVLRRGLGRGWYIYTHMWTHDDVASNFCWLPGWATLNFRFYFLFIYAIFLPKKKYVFLSTLRPVWPFFFVVRAFYGWLLVVLFIDWPACHWPGPKRKRKKRNAEQVSAKVSCSFTCCLAAKGAWSSKRNGRGRCPMIFA